LKRLGINEQEDEFKMKITAAPPKPCESMRVENKVVNVFDNKSDIMKEID
jgi:hypothetical protein